MSGQEASSGRRRGLFDTGLEAELDSWPDAPEPSWLTDDDADTHESPTAQVPAYDLGPGTESVVVDLTGPMPTLSVPDELDETPADEVVAALPVEPPADVPVSPSPVVEPLIPAFEAPPLDLPRNPTPEAGVPPEPVSVAAAVAATEVPPAPPLPVVRDHAEPQSFAIPPVPQVTGRNQAETLTAATVLRTRKARPQSGWRKTVLHASGGRINFGPSPTDRRRADLVSRARTPVVGCHRVAIISLKGGVGKTTTTAALGAMFANLRGDRVIAVDANPDRGTLIERVPRESGATVRHLLESRDRVTRYGDVRAFTSQSSTRLEVLASDADPGASSALSEQDYRNTVDTLERFYNLILTDCGTGLLHDAMRGVLGLASSLVVVSSASLDGARSASATLDWLEAHGMQDIAKDAVVVISSVRPGGGIVDVMQLEDHFAARCRAVVTIPYDPHLEAGGVMDLDELHEDTLDAYKELAAAVGEGFAARR
jgi:MinD-like ATPase involved in chromosome partitioning or flagellar assembly